MGPFGIDMKFMRNLGSTQAHRHEIAVLGRHTHITGGVPEKMRWRIGMNVMLPTELCTLFRCGIDPEEVIETSNMRKGTTTDHRICQNGGIWTSRCALEAAIRIKQPFRPIKPIGHTGRQMPPRRRNQ